VEDSALMVRRFRRLMRELENGTAERNSFREWEVELLVDLQTQDLGSNRRRLLQRYERAVERGLERGDSRPLRLSDYLARTRSRRWRASAA